MSSTSLFKWMGIGTTTKPPHDVSTVEEGERYLGLENFGNTCYCNSVLQALYYCKPFRDCLSHFPLSAPTTAINHSSTGLSNINPYYSLSTSQKPCPMPINSSPHISGRTSSSPVISGSKSLPHNGLAPDKPLGSHLSPGLEDTLFAALKDLFWEISTHRKKTGVVAPVNFINKVKKENELFRSSMHQDAHEFLNYLLNTIAEDVEKYQNKELGESDRSHGSIHSSASDSSDTNTDSSRSTWVHQLFEGVFSNETKCLTCETVTSRDESFMDLSIDVEMNSSVTSCLRQFSASETLCHQNKYFCDECSGLQEAERRMKIKKLPSILALHLKRFKYQEQLQKYIKLTYRVVFPFELRLFNTCDETEDADRLYELWACVIHIGSGPHHGHYVTVIKSNGQWMLFDDDEVTNIQEEDIQKYFSDLPGSGSGYVLFYQAVDLTTTYGSGDGLHYSNGNSSNTRLNGDNTIHSQHELHSPNYTNGDTLPSSPSRYYKTGQDSNAGSNSYFYPSTLDTPSQTPDLTSNMDRIATNNRESLPPSAPSRTRTWGLGRKIREKREKR